MAHCHVPVVAIGVNRDTAILTSSALQALNRSNYPLVACLDCKSTPEPYNFSLQNLGAVLYALYPRPKALVTGTAVSTASLAEIEKVWEEYVERVIAGEKLGGHCWVQVRRPTIQGVALVVATAS